MLGSMVFVTHIQLTQRSGNHGNEVGTMKIYAKNVKLMWSVIDVTYV